MIEEKIGRLRMGSKLYTGSWQGSIKGGNLLKDLGIDGRLTLK
jgi:hypothetical protein